MSSEIFYAKAFLRVGDRFIPVVNHGSSNCYDFDSRGREIPERHWSVLSYPFRGRLAFTAAEIKQIAAAFEEANTENRGGTCKSRNRAFEVGEFGRWILAGLKSAHTVEEYRAYGNSVVVIDYERNWSKASIASTAELSALLDQRESDHIGIGFADDRNIFYPKISRKKQPFDFGTLDRYYVLQSEQGFFVKRSSRRVWATLIAQAECVKKVQNRGQSTKVSDSQSRIFLRVQMRIYSEMRRKQGGHKMKETKNARFRRVAEARVNKTIRMLRLLGNCSGTNTYAYDADAVEQIFTALQIELDQARKRFSENGRPGRNRFSLSQAPMPDTVSYPHITLPLPDGTHLRAVAYADTTYPAINLYLLRDGEPEELVCFAEYNSEHSPCHELCIGVYTSDAEDTQYYGPYRPERETEYGKGD